MWALEAGRVERDLECVSMPTLTNAGRPSCRRALCLASGLLERKLFLKLGDRVVQVPLLALSFVKAGEGLGGEGGKLSCVLFFSDCNECQLSECMTVPHQNTLSAMHMTGLDRFTENLFRLANNLGHLFQLSDRRKSGACKKWSLPKEVHRRYDNTHENHVCVWHLCFVVLHYASTLTLGNGRKMIFWWLHIYEEQSMSMQGIKTRSYYVGCKRKKEKKRKRKCKDYFCEDERHKPWCWILKQRDHEDRSDDLLWSWWDVCWILSGATRPQAWLGNNGLWSPSPPAWQDNNWWTMENNGDCSCEQRTDLQLPSPFCVAHFLADKNSHFYDKEIRHIGQ